LAIENATPDFWTVGFDFEREAEIENNNMFLDIWDETGEPFEISHKQARFKILKTDEGKYYTERF
jgi:hypothetical protein